MSITRTYKNNSGIITNEPLVRPLGEALEDLLGTWLAGRGVSCDRDDNVVVRMPVGTRTFTATTEISRLALAFVGQLLSSFCADSDARWALGRLDQLRPTENAIASGGDFIDFRAYKVGQRKQSMVATLLAIVAGMELNKTTMSDEDRIGDAVAKLNELNPVPAA